MEAWHDFLMAVAGASAALVGLLFVGLSINLDRLLAIPHLLLRAGASLLTLGSMLVISCLLLAPGYTLSQYGLSIMIVAVITWGLATFWCWRAIGASTPEYRRPQVFALAVIQLATLPGVVAGFMVWRREEDGLDWLVPTFLAALIVAMANSWVLTVESRR